MKIVGRNIQKEYNGVKVLDVDCITIDQGSFCAIIGPNGAGKTTLMKMIAGLDSPTQGQIGYGEEPTTQIPKEEITMVFQRPYLLHTTVAKNIGYPLRIRKWPKLEIRKTVENLADDLGLSALLERKAWTLSAGEKQKTALARALSFRPKLLLLDEPTANIDPGSTLDIETMLKKRNNEDGTTIVFITHNLSQAKRLCDKIYFLHEGKLVEFGEREQVLQYSKNELTKRFLAGEII